MRTSTVLVLSDFEFFLGSDESGVAGTEEEEGGDNGSAGSHAAETSLRQVSGLFRIRSFVILIASGFYVCEASSTTCP